MWIVQVKVTAKTQGLQLAGYYNEIMKVNTSSVIASWINDASDMKNDLHFSFKFFLYVISHQVHVQLLVNANI